MDSPMENADTISVRIRETQDEREDVQKKTFGKWMNSQLAKANHSPVTDLFYDLRDGTRLLVLLGVLTGEIYRPEKGRMRLHHLNNVNTAIKILANHSVKLVNISNDDIVDGNPKLTLGLVWSIILHWQVTDVMKNVMQDLRQTNMEKTLLAWCRQSTKDFPDVNVVNFTSSWTDGLAFNAIIHKWRPNLFDYELVSRKPPLARLDHAFRMAQKHLQIERLLDPEDVYVAVPDKKSVMLYVMCLFQTLPHSNIVMEDLDVSVQSDPSFVLDVKARPWSTLTTESVDFSSYQSLLEEVLVWLLAADDRLDCEPAVGHQLDVIKEQFHAHEEFLLELTAHQNSVGEVLQEGSRLLGEGTLNEEEAEEIRVQMKLLNSRWEGVRVKAMDRQAQIHQVLMSTQQSQLDQLRGFLTQMEDKMSHMEDQVINDMEGLRQAANQHQLLQRELQAEQALVSNLSNLVVVVDESTENNYSQMEDQLSALGERWSHLIQWAEDKGRKLDSALKHWLLIVEDLSAFRTWLLAQEHALRELEANPSADRSALVDIARQLQVLEIELIPYQNQLSQVHDGITSLPNLLRRLGQTKTVPSAGQQKAVMYLQQEAEALQDRLEALTEIMQAQRQRLAKCGLNWKESLVEEHHVVLVEVDSKKRKLQDGTYVEALRSLRQTLTTLGTAVIEETFASDEHNHQMLTQTKESLVFLNNQAEALQVLSQREDCQDLLRGVEELRTKLSDQEARIEHGINRLRHMRDEMVGLGKWLAEVEVFIGAEKAAIGDVETLEAQLEQSNALQDDVSTLQPHLEDVSETWAQLEMKLEPKLAATLAADVHQLNERWTRVILAAEAKNQLLKKALSSSQKVLDGIKAFDSWLGSLEAELQIPEEEPIKSPSELSVLLRRISELKDKLDCKAPDYLRLFQECSAMTDVNTTSDTLSACFASLKQHWDRTAGLVGEKHKSLKEAAHDYGDYQFLLGQERDWLDKLERKLKRPQNDAVDAEDLSEELDDLENFLKNRPSARLERLQSIVERIRACNIMTHLVQTEFALISQRWTMLDQQATERTLWLEKTVRGAQQVEQLVLQLQDGIIALENDVSAHLDQDLTGNDLPEASQKLASDLAVQETSFEELRQLEESYRREGREEAASRLHEQLELINHYFKDVKQKITAFQQPTSEDLFSRLHRMSRVMRDLEQGMCFIELASDDTDAIQGQLSNCVRFYENLGDMKGDLEALIKEGRTAVENQCVAEPAALSAQLDAVKALYNQLGGQVTSARETLESALQLSNQLNGEMSVLHEWMATLEMEIDRRETESDSQVIDHQYYEQCMAQLDKHRLQRTIVEEAYTQFCALCDPALLELLKEKVEDTKARWNNIELRLEQRLQESEAAAVSSDGSAEEAAVESEKEEVKTYRTTMYTQVQAPAAGDHAATNPQPNEGISTPIPDEGYCNAAFDDEDRDPASPESSSTELVVAKLEISRQLTLSSVEEQEDSSSSSVSTSSSEDEEEEEEKSSSSSSESVLLKNSKSADPVVDAASPVSTNDRQVAVVTTNNHRPAPLSRDNVNLAALQAMVDELDQLVSPVEPEDDVFDPDLNLCVVSVRSSEIVLEMAEIERIQGRLPSAEQAAMEIVRSRPPSPGSLAKSQESVDMEDLDVISTLDEDLASAGTAGTPEHDLDPAECWMTSGVYLSNPSYPSLDLSYESEAKMTPHTHLSTTTATTLTDSKHTVTKIQTYCKQGRRASRDEATQTDLSCLTESPVILPQKQQQTPLSETRVSRSRSPEATLTPSRPAGVGIPTSATATTNVNFRELDVVLQETLSLDVSSRSPSRKSSASHSRSESITSPIRRDQFEHFGAIHSPRRVTKAGPLVPDGEASSWDPESDSFNGSDKETDDVVEFSQTESPCSSIRSSAVSSSSTSSPSSSESDADEKPTKNHASSKPTSVTSFENEIVEMLARIEQVKQREDQNAPIRVQLEDWELGMACLEPDVASLISKGDSLVLQVQTLHLQQALEVHATTGQLRAAWAQLKAEGEARRLRATQQEALLQNCVKQTEELTKWMTQVAGALETGLTDANQLLALEAVIGSKQADIRSLNKTAISLQEQHIQDHESLVANINLQWQRIQNQFQSYQSRHEEDCRVGENMVADWVTRINKLREAVSSCSRQLHSPPLSLKEFEQLANQDETLKSMKAALKSVREGLDTVEHDKGSVSDSEQAKRVWDKLQEEWSLLQRNFGAKQSGVEKSLGKWRQLHNDLKVMEDWLLSTEEALREKPLQGADKEEVQKRVKDLDKQCQAKKGLMTSLINTCKDIASQCAAADGNLLREKIDSLNKRWKVLFNAVTLARESANQTDLSKAEVAEILGLNSWLHRVQHCLETHANPADAHALHVQLNAVKNYEEELTDNKQRLKKIRDTKLQASSDIDLLLHKLEQVEWALAGRREAIDLQLEELEKLMRLLDNAMEDTNINKNDKIQQVMNRYSKLDSECKLVNAHVPHEIQVKVDYLQKQKTVIVKLTAASPKLRLEGLEQTLSSFQTQSPFASTPSPNLSRASVPSTPTTPSTPSGTIRSSQLAAGSLVASLDKSILQIRDWLTLLEAMLKQQVAVVGEEEDIQQLLEKQKSVLHELEQKKPQLDELVQTAEGLKDDGPRQQLQAKVTKLREHWEETAAAVTSRRAQLDALLSDSQRFESKRQEVEQQVQRLEARMQKLVPVGSSADLLESQQREHKSLTSESQQIQHQLDSLNQFRQRLQTSYPHDDVSRVNRAVDALQQRSSALQSGVMARGKVLNSAMGSLHNLDRSIDKFQVWMSDAENALESLEMEVDTFGSGVRKPKEMLLRQLQELAAELEGRREEQASLSAAGQRLLATLESSGGVGAAAAGLNTDDALILRRRLDDMNRRWHGLRAKSVAIRNRLENNAEHWSALLLSLRELIEWVIRKDMELTSFGPLRGDWQNLQKQQDDYRAFRQQLEDKKPLIEHSIMTGRQLVASETPLSETSDSEAGKDMPGDSRGYRSAEEAARELTRAIKREVSKLSERWALLWERAERWHVELDSTGLRLRHLQQAMDDVAARLNSAEALSTTWPLAGDVAPAQLQQQLDLLKEYSEGLNPVQESLEDINDQAARLADAAVPLSHSNLARLDDLNSRWKRLQNSFDDRYQALTGLTRDKDGTGQVFLAKAVDHPWERALSEVNVPYYINHQTETTHWDHPRMEELMSSLTQYNDVRFSAYRTAAKLRQIQKALCLDRMPLVTAIETFDAHGLRAQNDRVIDVPDMVAVVRSLYEVICQDGDTIPLPLGVDLCINWILNVYDNTRIGEVRVLSFKIGIALLCQGHLEEKYRYLFRLIADANRLVDGPKLGLLLYDCIQIPRELGEVAAFGGSNIGPSVRSCLEKAGKCGQARTTIEAVHFLAWLKQEPQCLVWLPVLHRLSASEKSRHQAKCNVCKTSPIVGLRYRCLKCFSFDMCQHCFFIGKLAKSHKLSHPMQEYCATTTSGEDIKDFTRAIRNKFKSKRYFKKHPRLGYLPVQTLDDGGPTPESASPSNPPSQPTMDSPSLKDEEDTIQRINNTESTPDSEDERQLVSHYGQRSSANETSCAPKSPMQVLASVEANHKEELETMIRELEEENANLQAEYDRLRSQQSPSLSLSLSSSPDDVTNSSLDKLGGNQGTMDRAPTSDVERDMLAEARLLRQHKSRLEARMRILEDHNRQLEAQLSRLRQLLDEPGTGMASPMKTGTLQTRSVTASQLATDSPARNGHLNDSGNWSDNGVLGGATGNERIENRPPPPAIPNQAVSTQHVGNLLSMAGDLGKAVGTLVTVMTDEDQSPPLSDDEEEE